tara:strand:- start:10546 stop:10968 length:423 start_codon:yes stop_codon:yes gene_type:complete
MGIFAGIEEVEVHEKTPYVEAGNYIGEVVKVKSGTKAETGQPYFVVEFEIIESDNPQFRVGEKMAWMKMVNKYKKYFLQDTKGFVATAMECSPTEVTEEVMEYVSGEEQPLVGKRLSLRAYADEKPNGKSYTETEFRLAS